MRFYNHQHQYYCGIDLHVKTMDVCILDATGQVLVHRNVPSTPEALLETVAPFRDDLVVAAECMFTWYWLADVCAGGASQCPNAEPVASRSRLQREVSRLSPFDRESAWPALGSRRFSYRHCRELIKYRATASYAGSEVAS